MIKHKDAAEDSSWNIDEHEGSAVTGRTLEEIKEELPPKGRAIPIFPIPTGSLRSNGTVFERWHELRMAL